MTGGTVPQLPWNAPETCEREFIHVMSFWFFLEMPQNSKNFNFGSFSICKHFPQMPHFRKDFFLEMPHFQIRWGNGAIRGKTLNRKGIEIKTLRILGHFKEKSKYDHVNKFSFTCFLGHLKVPPVYFTGPRKSPCNPTIAEFLSVYLRYGSIVWLTLKPQAQYQITLKVSIKLSIDWYFSTLLSSRSIFFFFTIFSRLGFSSWEGEMSRI